MCLGYVALEEGVGVLEGGIRNDEFRHERLSRCQMKCIKRR